MTTKTDLIFDEIVAGIDRAEGMFADFLTHKDANFLRGFVSDYLDYIAEGEGKLDETTTSPLSERSV